MSVNRVILVGNVGKDPVIRFFDKGVAKATFPLATSESYKNQQGETVTSTEWHNIVVWRALAEVTEKTVKKGSQVYIVGKIRTRSYVDKDNVNKYITEILADTVMVLDKKQGAGTFHTEMPPNTIVEKPGGKSVQEPPQHYSVTGGNTQTYTSDPGQDIDDFTKDGMISGQSDDDLPF